MRKVIKIFLASSIVQFSNERMSIENFIRNISDKFEENYDIKLQPLLCENFDDAYSEIRKQEEYNEKIRDSELCFFIFFTKAGKYTKEEFEVARKKFEETGKPKIYTYFKNVKDEHIEQSLYDFMNELDKTFGHYYGTFEHIDTVKLRILLSLKLREMDFTEIKVRNGECVVDGKPVMSLDNVSEFANNSRLKSMECALKELDDYVRKKESEPQKDIDELVKVKSRIQSFKERISVLQERIFKVSLNMSYDWAFSEMSERQKRAYRLFEQGDLYAAINQLPSDEIMDDFMRSEQLYLCAIEDAARKCIKEQLLAIRLLEQNVEVSSAVEQKIIERYKLIVPIIKKYKVEIDGLYDYMMFLDNNIFVDDNDELLRIAKDLFEIYIENPSYMTSLFSMYDTCSIIAENLQENDPEIDYYNSMAVQSLDEFLENATDKNCFSYARDCIRAAEASQISDEKASRLYKEAISVLEKLNASSDVKKQIAFCKNQIELLLG